MNIYADTSFLVSLYLPDLHTPDAERWIGAKPAVWVTPFQVAEWTLAIERHVFRGALARREADLYHQHFQEHRKGGVWVEVAMPESAFNACIELGRLYGARLGQRALDTLHVAVALELKATRFWTFDERQAKLARAVGLRLR